MVNVDQLKDNLTDKEFKAMESAVVALYLNDTSDYRSALWDIVQDVLGLDSNDDADFDLSGLAQELVGE